MFPNRIASVISKPKLINYQPTPEVYCTHDNDDDWMTNSQFDYKDMSVSLWHSGFQKSGDASADRYLVSMGESATKEFAIVINGNDLKVYARFSAHGNGGTDNTITINNVFTAWYWTHTLVTYSGTDSILRVYVDGALASSDLSAVLGYTGDSTSLGFDSNLHVNNRAHTLGTGVTFDESDGAFGDLAVYDKVLSADEVKRVYNNKQQFDHKNSVMKKNCKLWWRFGNGLDNSYPGHHKGPAVFYNQMESITHDVLFEDDTSANINNWDAAGSAHTVTHSTDILSASGNSGVVKIVGGDTMNQIIVQTASDISGIQDTYQYIFSCWLYLSSSGEDFQGMPGSIGSHIWTLHKVDEDAGYSNARTKSGSYAALGGALGGGLDMWQRSVFYLQIYGDTAFKIKLVSYYPSSMGEGAVMYLSDFKIESVYNKGLGHTNNGSSSGQPIDEGQGYQYWTLNNNTYRGRAMGLHGPGTWKTGN